MLPDPCFPASLPQVPLLDRRPVRCNRSPAFSIHCVCFTSQLSAAHRSFLVASSQCIPLSNPSRHSAFLCQIRATNGDVERRSLHLQAKGALMLYCGRAGRCCRSITQSLKPSGRHATPARRRATCRYSSSCAWYPDPPSPPPPRGPTPSVPAALCIHKAAEVDALLPYAIVCSACTAAAALQSADLCICITWQHPYEVGCFAATYVQGATVLQGTRVQSRSGPHGECRSQTPPPPPPRPSPSTPHAQKLLETTRETGSADMLIVRRRGGGVGFCQIREGFRCHRASFLFAICLPQFSTMTRNLVYILYACHWAGEIPALDRTRPRRMNSQYSC